LRGQSDKAESEVAEDWLDANVKKSEERSNNECE